MNKLAAKIVSFLKRVDIDKLIIVFIVVYFVAGLLVSLFSNGLPDEYLYLFETSTIANLFREGKWIGADLTGTHGFLFKLPVALSFIIFGKSLFIARLFNVYLTCLFIFALYKFGQKLLTSKYWSFLFVILTCTSYQFVRSVPSYLREIPALLSLVLLLSYVHDNKKVNIKHGLLLLLLLDAKEYVAVFFGISLAVYYLVSWLRIKIKFGELVKNFVLFASPSLLYITLMLTTNIIPYNDMMAKSLFIRGNLNTKEKLAFNSDQTPILRNSKQLEQPIFGVNLNTKPKNKVYFNLKKSFGNTFYWKYLENFWSPRTFTVTSVPKIIILIAITGAVRKFSRGKSYEQLLFTFFVTYLTIYFFKSSVERYLLHLTPLIFYYFVSELKHFENDKKTTAYLRFLIVIVLITAAGFIFDNFIILPKVILNFVLVVAVFSYLITKGDNKYFGLTTNLLLYSTLIPLMWLFGSYKFGTINQYFYYGKDFEYPLISTYFSNDKSYWYNGDLNYLYFDKNLRLEPPVEKLKYNFRKTEIVKRYEAPYVRFNPDGEFLNELDNIGVESIVYIRTTDGHMMFPYQKVLDYLTTNNALNIDKVIPLKNKQLLVLKTAR